MAHMDRSLWREEVTLPSFPRLEKNISTHVLILGGGLAGVLCAYRLRQQGVPCLLCEAATIGSGTTAGTTAVLSAQHDTLYSDLVRTQGEAHARLYLEANLAALHQYRALAEAYAFDFEEIPACIYSKDDRPKMEAEVRTLRQLGFAAEFRSEIPLPIPVAGAVCFPGQAQMHPLKFLRALCPELPIFEHTPIRRIAGSVAYGDGIQIHAEKIIVATHFPILNTHGLYCAKLYQKRSYVIALEHAQEIPGSYVDNEKNGMYFRRYNNLLLIGGGDHRTGKQGGGFSVLRRFASRHYPNATERYAWATQDCMSLDGVPYIGAYSPALPHVFVATGFNEWGMTSSMAAADILCALVMGQKSPFAAAFSPGRRILRPQLFCNMGATMLDFFTPTTKRCPHLGCGLKWNPLEHSWDCPCHGSRFDEQGKLLNNPATGDLHK